MNYRDYFPLGDKFVPTSSQGDLYSKFPKQLKKFNIINTYGVSFKHITNNRELTKAILFCEQTLCDSEAHTMEKYIDKDVYACFVYSQKIIAYSFLNTLQYREEKKQISSELCELMSVFIITSFVGNKINYLIDFETLDNISKLDDRSAKAIMTTHLYISRANMNWIYADNCPNLQNMLVDARNTLFNAIRTRPEAINGILDCKTAMAQWDYTRKHIYGNSEKPPWKFNHNDTGIYLKSRESIESHIETTTTTFNR